MQPTVYLSLCLQPCLLWEDNADEHLWSDENLSLKTLNLLLFHRKQPDDMTSLDHSLKEEVFSALTVYV